MTNTLEYDDISIQYLGHSGFLMQQDKLTIVIDPFLSNAPMAVIKPKEIKATDILLTHGHSDHLGDAI